MDVNEFHRKRGADAVRQHFDQNAEKYQAKGEAQKKQPRLIQRSSEFLSAMQPPDYLVDGILQRRFCYSLTALTGHAKTAIALVFAASIALGKPIGPYQVEKGRVLYFAGENPEDIRMRWAAMSDAMGFDESIDVVFLPGVFKISQILARVKQEIEAIGPLSLVIVDTSAAYFEGDDENTNVQMGTHARLLRSLVNLPGGPTVLVCCHPVKNAGQDNLIPRGGGAFLNEVDGNLTLWKIDDISTLHWQGKFRGPDFAPVPFLLKTIRSDKVKDTKGRQMPNVMAKALTESESRDAAAKSISDEDALLQAIAARPRAHYEDLCIRLGWIGEKGAEKWKVTRVAKRLLDHKLIRKTRTGLEITEKGLAELKARKGKF
jgi:hypothetical protein